MDLINTLKDFFIRLVLIFIPVIYAGCSGGGYPSPAGYDLNNDGYSDLIVGSHGGYGGSQDYVYIFYGSLSGIGSTPNIKLRYDKHNAFTVGDLNGDGYMDLVVAVNEYDNVGRVYIHLGKANEINYTPDIYLDGEPGYKNFGDSLSIGDMNGDAYLDLLVGAGNFQGGNGRVYIFLGTKKGVDDRIWKTISYDSDGLQFGETLSTGDINGDGHDDLVIGAAGSRKILVYMGTSFNIEDAPSKIYDTSGGLPYAYFSNLKLVLADINSNGYADLVMSNRQTFIMPCPIPPYWDCGDTYHNAIQVAYGVPSGLEDGLTTVIVRSAFSGGLAVGDIDGDSYYDLAIGLRNGVYVHMGSASGISETTSKSIGGENAFGFPLAFGDYNGDGFSDLSVGEIGYNTGQYVGDRGKVYIYDGDRTGLIDLPLVLEGENTGDRFGSVLPLP